MKSKGPNPILFLALAVATIIVGGGACYWQWSTNGETETRLETLRKEDKDEAALKRELDTAMAALTAGQEKLSHLERSVSQAAYVPTLLKELENVGLQNGIQVTGVRPVMRVQSSKKPGKDKEAKQERKPYVELDIEVRGRGTYGSAMRFVNALGTFPKIVSARTVAMTPKIDRENMTEGLDLTVELRTYVFPPAKKDDTKTALRVGEAVNNG